MLPKCPEEAIRPMFVPQFQPGLCEPANRSGTREVGYSFPEDVARQAASFAIWRVAIGELAVDHAVADGRNVGGLRKAHSVSTWPTIQDESLRVGGLVDTGWGLHLLPNTPVPFN